MKLKNKKKGFTLVELIVVMAIIAILSAVSVSSYFLITNQAKQSAATQTADALRTEIFALTSGNGYEYKVDYGTSSTLTYTYTFKTNSSNNIDVTWSSKSATTNSSAKTTKLNVQEDVVNAFATIWADTDSTKVSEYAKRLAFYGKSSSSTITISQISAYTNGIWATFSVNNAATASTAVSVTQAISADSTNEVSTLATSDAWYAATTISYTGK